MSRQEVDIGVVGNDGTGDSIREAFRKVNDNFREIYAVFGQGDTINLQDLGNVPDELGPNRVLATDSNGLYIKDRILEGGDGIEIDAVSDPDRIVINSTGTSLGDDIRPTLAGPMNANGNIIANLGDPTPQAVELFNSFYENDGISITLNNIAITKGYADKYYIRKTGGGGGSGGQIRVRNEPIDVSEYTLTITNYTDGNAIVPNHGYDSSIDGAVYVYNSTINNANNLKGTIPIDDAGFIVGRSYRIETLGDIDFTELGALRNKVGVIFKVTTLTPISAVTNMPTVKPVYFIKYVNANQLSFHPSLEDAQIGTNKILVSGGSGVQTLTDAYLNTTLSGNWASNEVLPRESIVRREGDTMTGVLNLSDHPFPLQGVGTPNRPDDLQAATKYYVDNSSFASQVDLYVSANGKDVQLDTPPGKEGRAWAYAYKSVGKACERAEYMMNNAVYETGPYRQLISYGDGDGFSVVTYYDPPGTNGIARIKFSNNDGSNVDQGSLNNVDITPGKLLKGRSSGATGFIYKYYGVDGLSLIGEDYIDLQYVQGEFLPGENLEFGDAVKNLHITIHVESGIYEEDYPIKIPPNTAIVGDEFRRVLIRPKDRISQSPWVDTWFFRNSLFDGLTVTSGGTQFDSTVQGWYGYHYLKNPNQPVNRGPTYTNAGNYDDAADAIEANKLLISQAIVTYINTLGVTLTPIEESKSIRDTGYILDAIIYDLQNGGMEKILEMQEIFSNVTTLSANCKQGLNYIDNHINTVIIPDEDQTVKDLITAMIAKINFGFDSDYNTPKNNKEMDVFLCNDSTIVRQVTCQGHGGFMMVLDPEGQILTKSPYCQQSGSFSGSLNKKAFRGGQYIDGFSGNLTPEVVSKDSNTRLTITGIPRAPQTPTSFFILGTRYKVDSWVPHAGARPNAGDLLKLNKYFIQNQAMSYVKEEYPDTKFPYSDIEKLINAVIDAITFDVTNGGNSKTISITKKFFNRSNNELRFTGIVKSIVLDSLNYIKNTVADIVSNDSVTVNQDLFTQVIDPDRAGESGSTSILNLLLNNLILCIDEGIENMDDLDFPTFTLVLDSLTPLPTSLNPDNVTLITPGNTSMLSNDFTQVNDLGYGIVTNNNGLAECVSVFSYYCWTSMFSSNGGQMRSLNSSSANGEYGLVAAGSDPLEVPDTVILADNTVQVATVVKRATSLGDLSTSNLQDALFIYIDNFQYAPYNVSIVEINHGPTIGIIRYEMNNIQVLGQDTISGNTVVKLNFNTAGNNETSTSGLKADLNDGDKVIIRSGQNFKFNQVVDTNPVRPSTALTFEGDPINDINAPVYRVISYNIKGPANEDLNPTISNPGGYTTQASDIESAKTDIEDAVVAYINGLSGVPLDADEELKSRRDTGLIVDAIVSDLDTGGVAEVLSIVQSFNAAVITPNCRLGILYIATYINSTVIPGAGNLAVQTIISDIINRIYTGDQAILTFDTTYSYIGLIVDFDNINNVDPSDPAKTLGAQAGDTKVAVKLITDTTAISRLNTTQMITAWDGKLHRVTAYTPVLADNYAYVTLSDTDSDGNNLPYIDSLGDGLYSSLDPAVNLTLKSDSDIVLRAGLSSGEQANITVRISTMRATGHDFLDVGTGSYNTSNYPSKIYGAPKDPNQAREVEERTRGRVFYVSTDQDGFFRVGRFFTVDQGTGTVTFSASIALSNLDGIGFKRGISISEFSSDDKFTDLAQDAVPTEAAISAYLDRRLGLTRQGLQLDNSELFPAAPGFIDRQGINYPLNDIDWGNNKITNLKAPTGVKDAVNKNYVDVEVNKFNTLGKLNDVISSSAVRADVLAFTGSLNSSVHATVTGDLSATLESTATSTITEGILSSGPVTVIKLADASLFPNDGYVLIDNEIFRYSSKTTGGPEQLNGVIRVSEATDNDVKFNTSFPQAHSIGATVTSLNTSLLNYQINPGVIVNADVNANAGIVQSKLSLQKADLFTETDPTSGWTNTNKVQADLGLSKFSNLNFDVDNGYIRIKDGGVARIEQENVDPNKVIGNLTATATFPQQLLPEDVLKRATWNALNATSTLSRDHVFTFMPSSTEAASTFSSTEINSNVTANSIVKRTATGNIKISKIDTNNNVTIIEASGSSDLAAPVIYKGQWSPGTSANFIATDIQGGITGSVPYQSSADSTSFVGPNINTIKKLFTQFGDGTTAEKPAWSKIQVSIPVSRIADALGITNYTDTTLVCDVFLFSASLQITASNTSIIDISLVNDTNLNVLLNDGTSTVTVNSVANNFTITNRSGGTVNVPIS